MVWPVRLAPLYPHPGDSLSAWQVVLAALVLITITAAVWRFRARRYLLVGWLWFLGTLVPVIGLVQVGDAAMADRYAYIPLIGIFVMIAFGTADLAERVKPAFWPVVPATAALSLEGQEDEAQPHFAAAARINPRDAMSRSNLGTYFQTHNQPRQAMVEYESAVALTS